MIIEDIARIVYEANRTYNKTLRNFNDAPWEWYGDENKAAYTEAVRVFINILNNPTLKGAELAVNNVNNTIFTSLIMALKPFLDN